ncbi:MAG: cytochrome c biogenesis protein CcsA [Proteobacteria bacterium]|nr:cytochrome c biogenesis protein CcsA [Pseudomonadota bacterium]
MPSETILLDLAALLYLAAAGVAVIAAIAGKARDRTVLTLLAAALALHTGAIALRWLRLDHGPYVNLFEILSSNVWSLHLIALLASLGVRRLRGALVMTLPVLGVLVLWMMATPARDTAVPMTYQTIWLPVHMVLGKLFLGLVVMALGLCLVVVARRAFGWRLSHAPDCAEAEGLAHRVMLAAVVFQTLMLVAGAAWARDAWGRYWAWDPLESWAFLTWLAVLAYLHWRPRNQGATVLNAALVIGIYVIAFATFFGVPFVSLAPHKGAI